MIPYFSSTTYHVFGLPLQTWGTFVAIGFGLGAWLAARRAKRKGLDPERVYDLAFWIFIAAFLGARLFHVAFYEPGYYLQHPWEAINPLKPGYAMFGGFLGAAAAFFWQVRRRALDWVSYADVLMWGLPWGCGVGRIGCFLIHDHPGTLTSFALGVKYPDGQVRHDLGFYLSLIGFATGMGFLWLDRRPRGPGYWFGAFLLVEGLIRFTLDFLRVVDVRYAGFTPTQFLAIPMALVGIAFVRQSRKRVVQS